MTMHDAGPSHARLVIVGESVLKRFFAFVKVQPQGCWLWTGGRDRKGYGKFWYGGRTGRAHRFACEVAWGLATCEEPDHLCKNPPCVNPFHLEPVTRRVNLVRGDSPVGLNARKTQCAYGHPFVGDSFSVLSTGERRCRKCDVRRSTEYYWRHHEKAKAKRREKYARLRA